MKSVPHSHQGFFCTFGSPGPHSLCRQAGLESATCAYQVGSKASATTALLYHYKARSLLLVFDLVTACFYTHRLPSIRVSLQTLPCLHVLLTCLDIYPPPEFTTDSGIIAIAVPLSVVVFFFFLHAGVFYLHVCVHHVHACSLKRLEGLGFRECGVTNGCEPP